MSCVSVEGLEGLAAAVGELYDAGVCALGHDAVIWEARHEAALRKVEEYLSEAIYSLESGGPADAVCSLCEAALAELCGTDGRGVSEDIVSEIFSKFCVGK